MADSPFARYLGTNYAATEDEIAVIEKLIAEPTRQLLSLESEIAKLQKSIEKLEETRRDLSTYVEAHKALISPIRRMPLDVLSEIFVACLPTHRNCVMSASEAPILLGHICSSWRTLSLCTPRLWASLHVVQPRGNEGYAVVWDRMTQRLETMKMWLRRSGQCPLSISLQIGLYHTPADTQSSHQSIPQGDMFLRELIPFAGRWRSVRFILPFDAIKHLEHLTVEDIPMLQDISVMVTDREGFGPSEDGPDLVTTQFKMLDSPRIARFSGCGRDFGDLGEIPLHWDSLQELSIGGFVWESALDGDSTLQLLSRCTRLRSCKLVVYLSREQIQHPPVELPFLHTLYLDVGNMSSSSSLLDHLNSPALRTLVFRGNGDGLPTVLASCSCLESVTIEISFIDQVSLLLGLSVLPPTMRHLSLHKFSDPTIGGGAGSAIDDEMLDILIPNPGGQYSQCPSLETLDLGIGCQVSESALQRFISQRMKMTETPCLKRVRVSFGRPTKLDIVSN
ncbi:hypothetical protein R3P38DRAFT_1948158 [Favolaschia claudopus]|uniref:F-box domain-containing protein n=1 Tax=Favolaschia claudopus TaxID=2862362 RepID=A0AAW0A0S1_9AGAR